MKKEKYEKYINPKAYESLYIQWASKGKPKGNDPLYLKIWDGATNAVKACVGALQEKYKCTYQNYDNKVLGATMKVIKYLLTHDEPPKNIVNVAWFPTLGTCCGNKALQEDFEDSMLSTNSLNEETEMEFEEILGAEEYNSGDNYDYDLGDDYDL